ncbi:MAG: 16S rRNA (uracil(1498)-N(3))-methyltransferase [Prevotellaceae bacterium]|jgi:16S rRNA (uracil1498-N3)-methyltransferase|nr:16S rRNA (uracil(1498)-N(3))-methyltransferase [Prevotellaceae bacterium]
MYLFYSRLINIPIHALSEEESNHCINVLRLSKGNTLYFINGMGDFYKAIIIDAHPKKCTVKIIENLDLLYKKHEYYLHIAIAPTKNIDRYEWFVEKAVEIGIDEITPLLCDRSERKIVKQDRSKKVAIAAMKQSLKAYLPQINDITDFSKFIQAPFKGKKYIAHCIEQEKVLFQKSIVSKEDILILIGPEGDFSKTEITLALNNGYQAVSLGNSRLRTETAGIVACNTAAIINQQ